MSIQDEIESIEQGLVDMRYDEDVMSIARSVEHLFPSMEDAAEYAQAYSETYDSRSQFFDPEGYAEMWHESFDGDMSGITGDLMYED
ncbi:hypothetical protein ACK3SF_01090 [Candidatus Nanosalina sp. VS9-1]|uniref:hypothetical protein n=1 Tax=Candidatus Nanosalina sp. VS9-1 TaxID=3388566 RepID=UPI0039E03759